MPEMVRITSDIVRYEKKKIFKSLRNTGLQQYVIWSALLNINFNGFFNSILHV